MRGIKPSIFSINKTYKKRNTELTHKYQTVFQVWQRNSVLIQCTTFKAGDDRISTLTEKQKEQFEAYMSAQCEVNVLTEGKMREI